MNTSSDFVSKYYADKELTPLNKVTLIIPTYNRNYYLSRCLWYHSHFPFAEIIIADSSAKEKRDGNKKIVKEIQSISATKITYLESDYPAEEYGGEIYRKWGDAVNHVNTEYSLNCTDKELIIPTTVAESVMFLDSHPEYSMADGLYYKQISKNVIIPWQGSISFNDDAIADRLKKLTGITASNQFAVQRAKTHKLIFERLRQYELFDIRFGETIIETLPIILGKTYRDVSLPMNIRDIILLSKPRLTSRGRNKRKAESSYSRYVYYTNYPEERRLKLTENLCFCLQEFVDDDLKSMITPELLHSIMLQRYPASKIKSNFMRNAIFKLMWDVAPYQLKAYISRFIGLDMIKPLRKSELKAETVLIQKILMQTEKFQKDDVTIPLNYFNE